MMHNTAVVLPETKDGRILFLVPWGPRVTIGTTDTAGGDIERPMAAEEDIDYLLRHVNKYMQLHLEQAGHNQHVGRLSPSCACQTLAREDGAAIAHSCGAAGQRRAHYDSGR